jgi:outer membrane receptor for ferric coprogen and ferric-rhodotorulic acid
MNVNTYINVNNAFNRPNYSPPSGVMTSSNFGKSTSAGNPRAVELGLRFQF